MARKSYPLHNDDDTSKMKEAVAWCLENGITFERTSKIVLKVQHLNYWPSSETVQIDGRPKMRNGTFQLFQNLALQNREWRKTHLGKFGVGVTRNPKN